MLFLEPDLRTAQAAAYAAVEYIQFEGAHFRREIAAKALCTAKDANHANSKRELCQVMPSRKMKKGAIRSKFEQSRPGTWHYPPLGNIAIMPSWA